MLADSPQLGHLEIVVLAHNLHEFLEHLTGVLFSPVPRPPHIVQSLLEHVKQFYFLQYGIGLLGNLLHALSNAILSIVHQRRLRVAGAVLQ